MLIERELRILQTIVEVYVRDGDPVSSHRVKESAGLPISTATIRNVMVKLESGGLISKPHTSAGRIPTDGGYRAYVDHLEVRRGFDGRFSQRFRDELRDQAVDINAIMGCASRILGGLSRSFAIVYGSLVQGSRLERIHLVDLGATRLLVVVNLVPDYERTVVLRMEKRFTTDVISRAEDWINRTVAERTLGEAKDALDSAVRDNVTDEGIIAREVAVHREDIFSDPPAVEFFFEDREHLLSQPEMSDPKLLQMLLKLLHNKQYLTSILCERLGEETQITIGREHHDEGLRPFSLVTAGYQMGIARGVLGIIGPTRMQYGRIQELVGSAARELRAFGEEYL